MVVLVAIGGNKQQQEKDVNETWQIGPHFTRRSPVTVLCDEGNKGDGTDENPLNRKCTLHGWLSKSR